MRWIVWLGLVGAVVASNTPKISPPPVMLELGPVVATPAPTPKDEQKKRLITTITVQNTADGDSVISFEATDVAEAGGGKTRVLASKRYSLAEEKSELTASRAAILRQIRDLERELLIFVEKAGPPKERAPIGPSESGGTRPLAQ